MSKYDKMVALNAERSKEKIEMAKKTIWDMVEKEEKVTIPKLMQKTGLFVKAVLFCCTAAIRRQT